jgi:hypothetical protein
VGPDGDIAVALSGDGGTFVTELDASGETRWSRPASGWGAGPVAATAGGWLAITHESGPEVDYRPTTPAVLTRWDRQGNALWRTRLGGDGDSVTPASIAVDGDGAAIVGGRVEGRGRLGGAPIHAREYEDGGFVVKVDAAGAHVWSAGVGSGSARVAVDAANDVIAFGSAADDPPSGDPSLAPAGLLVTKLDPAGRAQWTKRFGFDVYGTGVAIDAQGTLVAAGTFTGAVDFGRGVMRGQSDGFALALDASGATLWSRRIEPSGHLVTVDALGRAVMAGSFEVTVDGGPSRREGRVAVLGPPPAREEPGGPPLQPRAHKAVQSSPLQRATSGIDGRFELRLDARMKGDEVEGCSYYWAPGYGLGPDFDSPPLNAALAVVDEAGKTVDTMALDRPAAGAEVWKLHGDDRPTFAVTVNDGICAGPYRGPVVELFEVEAGRIRKLTAVSPGGKVDLPIGMNTSLYGATRTAPARHGKGRDVLYARVHDWTGGETVTTLTRWAFEGGRWVQHQRDVPGRREFEGPESLPPASAFP